MPLTIIPEGEREGLTGCPEEPWWGMGSTRRGEKLHLLLLVGAMEPQRAQPQLCPCSPRANAAQSRSKVLTPQAHGSPSTTGKVAKAAQRNV